MKNKKAFIDFTIHEDEYIRTIFRFLPSESHCHGFGDEPPKDWAGVYKVYYAYQIIAVDKENPNENELLFKCMVDEGSAIGEVAARCLHLSEGTRSVEVKHRIDGSVWKVELLNTKMLPIGYGVEWEIREAFNDRYEFVLFRWDNQGYRFYLPSTRIREFGTFLYGCCEYMLKHGEPI